MQRRLWGMLLVVLMMVLAACTAPVPPASDSGAATTSEEATTEEGAGGVAEFRGIWPYVVPPAGHFNTFVSTNRIELGIYHHLQEPPLFFYMWAEDDWMP